MHGCRLIGLTATLLREGDANWLDGSDLGPVVYEATRAELVPEYLAPVRCIEISLEKLTKLEVVEALLSYHQGDHVLVFVEKVAMAKLLACTLGIVVLDGSCSHSLQNQVLDDFRKGKIKCLVSAHLLDESADIPELQVVIQAESFFGSRRQEAQRLGRLARWSAEKKALYPAKLPTFYVLIEQGNEKQQTRTLHRRQLETYEHMSEAMFLETIPFLPSCSIKAACKGEQWSTLLNRRIVDLAESDSDINVIEEEEYVENDSECRAKRPRVDNDVAQGSKSVEETSEEEFVEDDIIEVTLEVSSDDGIELIPREAPARESSDDGIELIPRDAPEVGIEVIPREAPLLRSNDDRIEAIAAIPKESPELSTKSSSDIELAPLRLGNDDDERIEVEPEVFSDDDDCELFPLWRSMPKEAPSCPYPFVENCAKPPIDLNSD